MSKPVTTEDIYQVLPEEKIPWNIEQPPPQLEELLTSGLISPCRTIDLGCGTGNYALYLAGLGFEVTGVDSSPTAIRIATDKATEKGQTATFRTIDLCGELPKDLGQFDFAFEWEVLHHVFPEKRAKYIENVAALLSPDGIYFSVCFSEKDPSFGGTGKVRKTPLGTELYFSSEKEIEDLVSGQFRVWKLDTIPIPGKPRHHEAIRAILKKR
jgi:methyl halide transferase